MILTGASMMVNKLGLCVSIGLFYSMGFTNEVLWDFGVIITPSVTQNNKNISPKLISKEKKSRHYRPIYTSCEKNIYIEKVWPIDK